MPFITIDTNARTEVTAEMLDELSEIAVRVLNKPKNYVTVKINSGWQFCLGVRRKTSGRWLNLSQSVSAIKRRNWPGS